MNYIVFSLYRTNDILMCRVCMCLYALAEDVCLYLGVKAMSFERYKCISDIRYAYQASDIDDVEI